MARQHERDEARRTLWQERLEPARAPDLPAEKRLRRVAQALASKGWKIEVKDLTPELRDLADDYLAVCGMPNVVRPSELWLVDADRWVRALKNQWSQTFYGEGSKYDAFFFGFRLF